MPEDASIRTSEEMILSNIIIPLNRLSPKPRELTFEEACVLPFQGCLSLYILADLLSSQPDKRLLIHGADTPIGLLLAGFAKRLNPLRYYQHNNCDGLIHIASF